VHEDNNPGAPHLIEAFLGVPFAQTTGGKNRFQPAVPLQPLDDIKVVDNIGPGCIGASDGGFISEDCLNLNIWRSAGIPANTTVPVVVYIHGGAFTGGSNRERDMASFVAWSKQPILAVSINYRIGALGFLPSQFMEDHGTINLGLRDQLFALQWVHDNIEAFGGNKDEVTIMGASAGAHSIGHHLMYQIDQPPLFKRVVMESGAPTARACYPVNGTQHERQLQEFFALTGLNGTMSDEARWEALMHMDGLAIGRASKILMSRSEPSLRWPFQPAIDGVIIPKAPIDSWKAGEIHKVPILTGFNSDEGTGFIDTAVKESHEFRDFFETLIPKLSSADLKELEELYPDPATHPDSPYVDTRVGVGAQFKRLAAAFGHFAYICPVRHTAHFGPGITDVYLYQFAVNKTVNYGAAHGYNFEYVVFSGSVQGAGKEQKAISSAMHEYWANFVAHGKPGSLAGDDESLWEPYAAGEGQKKMVFGEGSDVRAGGRNLGVVRDFKQDDWPAACEWWWSKAHLTES
jgi:triacylglycerol lipase